MVTVVGILPEMATVVFLETGRGPFPETPPSPGIPGTVVFLGKLQESPPLPPKTPPCTVVFSTGTVVFSENTTTPPRVCFFAKGHENFGAT